MRLLDGTMVCFFSRKKSRNDWRICVLVSMAVYFEKGRASYTARGKGKGGREG
jgi:hypothetical protein